MVLRSVVSALLGFRRRGFLVALDYTYTRDVGMIACSLDRVITIGHQVKDPVNLRRSLSRPHFPFLDLPRWYRLTQTRVVARPVEQDQSLTLLSNKKTEYHDDSAEGGMDKSKTDADEARIGCRDEGEYCLFGVNFFHIFIFMS